MKISFDPLPAAGESGRSGIWRMLTVVGFALLAAWICWWTINLLEERVLFAERSWIQLPAFGVDFLGHVDKPTRTWLAHGDPYADQTHRFSYPPIVTRVFMWVKATDPQTSLRIWLGIAATCAAVGAVASLRTRKELGIEAVPDSLGIAAILFSTPVLFSLERGNYDLLIVPCVVAAAWLLKRRDPTADAAAGFFLAVAAWLKIYPGLLVFALFAAARFRAATWMLVWALLIGGFDVPELMRFTTNVHADVDTSFALARMVHEIHPWNHPLGIVWPHLWAGTPLAYVPGRLGSLITLGALFAWISFQVWRRKSEALLLPYLYWTVALASFIPPIANDYSLTPLALAVMALWTWKQPLYVHAMFAVLVLWWQPVALPIPGRVVMLIKLAGLIGAAWMLIRQCKGCEYAPPRFDQKFILSGFRLPRAPRKLH